MQKYKSFAPLFLLTFSFMLLLFPLLFTGKTLFLRDITYLFHPWKSLCSEIIIKGQMPLWNDFACSGMPLMANWQTGVFYPFSLLFYVLPFTVALKFYHFLHLFIAALFAWLFVRSRGLSLWASFTTAVLFSLNGYFITRLEFLSHIGVDAWLFAFLLFAVNPVLLGLTLSIAFFAGHQMFFVSVMILLLYIVSHEQSFRIGTIKSVGMAFVLAAGISACQLLPTIELARFSSRVTDGIAAATSMTNSLRFRDIAGLLNPLFFPSSILTLAGEKFPWAGTFYVGIAGFLAAIPALLQLSKKRILLFASVLAFIGILLSLGNSTIIYPWLYKHVYLFRIIRYPSQFMLLTVAGMSILAGYGTERMKFKFLIALPVLAELLFTGLNFQTVANDSFFAEKPAGVEFLQKMPEGRFILSPGTELDRHLRGKDLVDSWQGARSLLYGMVSLPYHLPNAYGIGDPLTPASIETMIDQAYRAGSAAAALAGYADMGVRYLVCKERLANASGYSLVYDRFPFIYRIDSLPSEYSITEGTATVIKAGNTFGKFHCIVRAASASVVLWKETFYPGWETYVNGKRSDANRGGDAFRSMTIPAGNSNVYQLYRPISFRLGSVVSILSIIALLVYFLLMYRNRRGRGEIHEGI